MFPQHVRMPNKIIVAAVDSADNKASFSNYSSDGLVEIAALGVDVPYITGGGSYIRDEIKTDQDEHKDNGTSYAAPLVAGAASLVLARYPQLKGQSILIKERLINTADIVDGTPDLTGYIKDGRRLNVYKAVGGDQADSPELSTFLLGNRHIPNTVSTRTGKYSIPGIYGNDLHLISCDIGEDNNNDQDMIILTGIVVHHTDESNLLVSKSLLLVNDAGNFIDKTSSHMNIGLYNLVGGDCGDVDGDGDNDLILANLRASDTDLHDPANKNVLLLNNGRGVFTDASDQLPNIPDISRDADLVDIDGDADLDIFVANSIDQQGRINGSLTRRGRSNVILLKNKNGSFSDASDRLPKENTASGTGNGDSHNAHVVDINKDGCPDIYVANQMPDNFVPHGIDQFFINHKDSDGNCGDHFTDEALSLGILAGRNQGRDSSKDMVNDGQSSDLLERGDSAHEADFADIDGDGDQDLIIARRQKETNLIYINNFIQNGKKNKTVSFSNESHRLSPNPRLSTSTLDVGDLTGDGCPDIIFGNGDLNTFEAYQDQMYVNTKNNDGECTGEFKEAGADNGLPQGLPTTTKHILFFDADNDHDLDVWFGNYGERDLFFFNTIH